MRTCAISHDVKTTFPPGTLYLRDLLATRAPGVGAGSYTPQHRVNHPRAASKKTSPLRGRGVPRERRGQVWEGCLPLTGGRCVGGLLEHGRNGLTTYGFLVMIYVNRQVPGGLS
jgi:hypothetical protein